MKKLLALLLVLSVAGSVFALDMGNGLTISGLVKAGIRVDSTDDEIDDTEDTYIKPYNNDWGGTFGARLTFAYTGDLTGLKIRLQGDAAKTKDVSTIWAKYAYGWLNAFDKQFVIYGGAIGDDLWGLGKVYNAFDPSYDAVTGVRLAFAPAAVAGLNAGIAIPFVGYNPDTTKPENANTVATLGHFFGNTILGATYGTDAFKLVAALSLHPDVNTKPYDANDVEVAKSYVKFLAGLELPLGAIKLGANYEMDSRKSEDHKNDKGEPVVGYSRIGLKAGYAEAPVDAYGQVVIWLPNDDKGGKSDQPTTEAAGDTSVGFEVKGTYKLNDRTSPYLKVGSSNISYLDGNGLYVQPGVSISFGDSSLEIFDKISKIGADEKIAGKISNQFQIDFNLSF